MSTTNTPDPNCAMTALKSCSTRLQDSLLDARTAAMALSGARATRALQLCDQIEQCIAWADRISFYLICDQRDAGELTELICCQRSRRTRKVQR
jgi:hypothetical protein